MEEVNIIWEKLDYTVPDKSPLHSYIQVLSCERAIMVGLQTPPAAHLKLSVNTGHGCCTTPHLTSTPNLSMPNVLLSTGQIPLFGKDMVYLLAPAVPHLWTSKQLILRNLGSFSPISRRISRNRDILHCAFVTWCILSSLARKILFIHMRSAR